MMTQTRKVDHFPHDRWYTWLATSGGIGLIPKAPGTWGSVPGVFLGVIILLSLQPVVGLAATIAVKTLILFILSIFSWYVIKLTESYWQTHDNKRIVIDEVIGQAVAVCFVSLVWWQLLTAFILFRVFDIAKPGPIGWLDRHAPGALGTLGDDLVAGLAAGLCCLILFQGVMAL